MADRKLTESTEGPVRRPLTIIALLAAGLALIMMVAVVFAAVGILPGSLVGTFVVVWLACLFLVFGITRYLKSDDR